MKNYICINDQKIEMTTEQLELIRAALAPNKKNRLRDIAAGNTFKLGEHELIVLEQSGDTAAVIRKDLLEKSMKFGSNNNFDGSDVDRKCSAFAQEIVAIIGEKNIVEHTVDLTSDDGLKDYGKVLRKASLLTTELYRRYVEILDKHKIEKWWWLATPFSTPKHDGASWVKCVAPSGFINHGYCHIDFGVRPFCILKSDIFVS